MGCYSYVLPLLVHPSAGDLIRRSTVVIDTFSAQRKCGVTNKSLSRIAKMKVMFVALKMGLVEPNDPMVLCSAKERCYWALSSSVSLFRMHIQVFFYHRETGVSTLGCLGMLRCASECHGLICFRACSAVCCPRALSIAL